MAREHVVLLDKALPVAQNESLCFCACALNRHPSVFKIGKLKKVNFAYYIQISCRSDKKQKKIKHLYFPVHWGRTCGEALMKDKLSFRLSQPIKNSNNKKHNVGGMEREKYLSLKTPRQCFAVTV